MKTLFLKTLLLVTVLSTFVMVADARAATSVIFGGENAGLTGDTIKNGETVTVTGELLQLKIDGTSVSFPKGAKFNLKDNGAGKTILVMTAGDVRVNGGLTVEGPNNAKIEFTPKSSGNLSIKDGNLGGDVVRGLAMAQSGTQNGASYFTKGDKFVTDDKGAYRDYSAQYSMTSPGRSAAAAGAAGAGAAAAGATATASATAGAVGAAAAATASLYNNITPAAGVSATSVSRVPLAGTGVSPIVAGGLTTSQLTASAPTTPATPPPAVVPPVVPPVIPPAPVIPPPVIPGPVIPPPGIPGFPGGGPVPPPVP